MPVQMEFEGMTPSLTEWNAVLDRLERLLERWEKMIAQCEMDDEDDDEEGEVTLHYGLGYGGIPYRD